MQQILQCRQRQVTEHKAEMIRLFYQEYYLILIGLFVLAFIWGCKIGKDISIARIGTQILSSGLLFLLSR